MVGITLSPRKLLGGGRNSVSPGGNGGKQYAINDTRWRTSAGFKNNGIPEQRGEKAKAMTCVAYCGQYFVRRASNELLHSYLSTERRHHKMPNYDRQTMLRKWRPLDLVSQPGVNLQHT
eukprot:1179671-Prorocentrum_minimum.AAC.6